MIISIIAAVAENNVIGINNKLPWKLPEDLKHFKKLTTGHTVIMGQKTFESIGKSLPGRTNIILSFDENFKYPECITATSIEEALRIASSRNETEVFIIGGSSVYKQTIEIADKLYITRIYHKFKGDVFFPKIDLKRWKILSIEKNLKNKDNLYNFNFICYIKK